MFDISLFVKGGPLMIPIILSSIIALNVFLERLFHLHRAHIDNPRRFMAGLRNLIKKNKIIEAISICNETPGPIAAVLKAGLMKHDHSKEEIKEAIEDMSLHEIPRLERRLIVLAVIAQIAPLMGLLGTVTGMIKAFLEIERKAGVVTPADLAKGIYEALVTTAFGLVVAIFTFVAYNYLVSRVDSLILDMEKSSTELVNILATMERDYEV